MTLNLLCSANFIFQTVTFAFSFVYCVDDSVVCFRIHTGEELLRADSLTGDALLKQLWQKGKWGKKMSKKESGVRVGREQKNKWSRVYVCRSAKKKKEKCGSCGGMVREHLKWQHKLSFFSVFSHYFLRLVFFIKIMMQKIKDLFIL